MRMEVEKRRSKGSFLNLFDWNGKSRKKLFSDTPNTPADPRQGKENEENMPKSQFNRIKVDENGASPRDTESCDFNCALSIDSDEGCGIKAPGLVARLMGLDSLPASTVAELSFTTLYGSNSLRPCHSHEDTLVSATVSHPANYINMPNKMEKPSWDAMESRAQKVQNRPIKRFQTEMLPPKSAKPIPVTHNKLLSPIKSPGVIPPKNAARIMEAAAKIIEGSPRAYMKNKVLSSSAQYASLPKLVNPSTSNPLKDKNSDRSNNVYNCTPALKGSRDSAKRSSHQSGSKGKTVSLATQAKANVDSRDSSTSNGNRGYRKQKEQEESKSSQRPIIQQVMQRRTHTNRNSNVPGQDTHNRNSLINKGKSASKDSDSNKPSTRTKSFESSIGSSKMKNEGTVNTNIGPKRSNRRAVDSRSEFSLSKTKNSSQKKRCTGRDVLNEARVTDNAVNNYEGKSIKCNITADSMNTVAFNMNKSKEVISFTFTSPLRRSMPELQSSAQVMGIENSIDMDTLGQNVKLHPKKLSLSPPGLHMVDGDALSTLLERKLQELASRINSSQCTLATEESSAGFTSLEDEVHTKVGTESSEQDRSFHPDLLGDKLDSMHDCDCSSGVSLLFNMNQLERSEALEEHGCSNYSEIGNEHGSQHYRAVTNFQSPLANESYLDSEDSAYGSTVNSSVQEEEVSNFSPTNESVSLEGELNSSQRSPSTLSEKMTLKQSSGKSNLTDFKRSGNLELEYVKDVVNNAELMAEDFVLGQTNKIVMQNLFDALESRGKVTENHGEEFSKLERKVLFDCVCECLELRCTQTFVGSCKAWPRWATSIQRKDWLAEDLYREMVGFKSTKEVTEDELVHKDMSSGYGRWVDFDIEAFEEGLEVEWDILSCLISELVSDVLLA
ncbi:hypothetical protein L6164_010454 [Bauhinia variegata]|uniref:Uncharacterized protein n=1 Tax=Bauhinia variegata TaxID=167791 RepID=A0ACB9PN24_BAUVA|nr:hypothetical protein L6164_010454 [Bauhinia variegata]